MKVNLFGPLKDLKGEGTVGHLAAGLERVVAGAVFVTGVEPFGWLGRRRVLIYWASG